MNRNQLSISFSLLLGCFLMFLSCDDPEVKDDPDPDEIDFENLLINQVDNVIIPTMEIYQGEMEEFQVAVDSFQLNMTDENLVALRSAFKEAYLAYQACAVHNFYATANLNFVNTTNLYPIDTTQLNSFIENESYNFSTTAQQRANGYPALDFMLYGAEDGLTYFTEDSLRISFLDELVEHLKSNADVLVTNWSGSLRDDFVGNVGSELGSSVSTQLNQTLVYFEEHVRENKVGLPIGLSGPLDTQTEADGSKIEAYFNSLSEENEGFTLSLVKAAVEEMEDIYLGTDASGVDGIGYEEIISDIDESVDEDIKAQYTLIYEKLDDRTSISGDRSLYDAIQGLITLYKSDLLPLLNIQDADQMNDGD